MIFLVQSFPFEEVFRASGKRTLTEEKTKEESKQCSQSQSYNEVRTDVQLSSLAAKNAPPPTKNPPNLFTRGCHSGVACMYELAGFRPDALPAATKKGFVSSQDWTRDLLLVKWKCKLKYKIILYKNSWWILYRLLWLNRNLFLVEVYCIEILNRISTILIVSTNHFTVASSS